MYKYGFWICNSDLEDIEGFYITSRDFFSAEKEFEKIKKDNPLPKGFAYYGFHFIELAYEDDFYPVEKLKQRLLEI